MVHCPAPTCLVLLLQVRQLPTTPLCSATRPTALTASSSAVPLSPSSEGYMFLHAGGMAPLLSDGAPASRTSVSSATGGRFRV